MDYLKFVGSKTKFHSRKWGEIEAESVSFTPASDGDLVVFIGEPSPVNVPYVRIHSECVFAEAFDSDFCDCADQLHIAMDRLVGEPNGGILFYLRFDGRGAGLSAKVAATKLEMEGLDTFESRLHLGVDPEGREFLNIGTYLVEKGYKKVVLLSNNPKKKADLIKAGLEVDTEPLYVKDPNENVKKLYDTKVTKFNHEIDL